MDDLGTELNLHLYFTGLTWFLVIIHCDPLLTPDTRYISSEEIPMLCYSLHRGAWFSIYELH